MADSEAVNSHPACEQSRLHGVSGRLCCIMRNRVTGRRA